MKHALLLLNLLAVFFTCQAQIQRPEKEFNELLRLQQKAKLGTEVWHELTNQLIYHYISSDIDQAEKSLASINSSALLSSEALKLETEYLQCELLRKKGRKEDALQRLQVLVSKHEQRNDCYALGVCYKLIAGLKHNSNHDVNLIPILLSADSCFSKVGASMRQVEVLTMIALEYRNQRNWPLAIQYAERAATIQQSLPISTKYANILEICGSIHQLNSDYIKSKYYFEKAVEVFTKLNQPLQQARLLGNIGQLENIRGDVGAAINYLNEANEIYDANNFHTKNQVFILNSIGSVHLKLKDYPGAYRHIQKSLTLAKKLEDAEQITNASVVLSQYFKEIKKYDSALYYNMECRKYYESTNNLNGIDRTISMAGNIYKESGNLTASKENYRMVYENALRRKNALLILNAIRALAEIAFLEQDFNQVLSWYEESLNFKESEFQLASLVPLVITTAKAHMQLAANSSSNPDSARGKAYEIAVKLIDDVMAKASNNSLMLYTDLNKTLSEIHEAYGNYEAAYTSYKAYLRLNEALLGEEKRNDLARNQLYYEFEKKEAALRFENELAVSKLRSQELLNERQKQEIAISKKEEEIQKLAYLKEQAERQKKDKEISLIRKEKEFNQSQLLAMTSEKNLQELLLIGQKKQQKWFLAGLILSFLLAVSVLFGLFRTKSEKKKTESLLLNILPIEVANELKTTGKSGARLYNNVTVLFTDFVNFTGISEQLSPTELVDEIHKNFTAFDAIIEKHGLEKIKTIGDAYLAVCGLPHETEKHAEKVISAALEICDFIRKSQSPFQVRVGINSGPVVAGIVGVKKYAYDIWGDTVNTAARLEQHSEAGKINISGSTYELVKEKYGCMPRGKIKAKNKGEIEMYFVNQAV